MTSSAHPMRVLLIRPPIPRHTIGLRHLMICEPLELEYVAAGLPNHRVEIFDMILEHGLERRLQRFQPQVVGTSCYINGVNEVKKLCRRVKTWNRDCLTIVGGIQAARVPEDLSDESVDCIVRGDGTSIIAELVEAARTRRDLSTIPGLALPRGTHEVADTGEREYMPHPDTLPFPRRDLLPHLQHRYYYLFHQPVALMKTAWGCRYDCGFCYTRAVTGGALYERSSESIADELMRIAVTDVYIVDDIFLTDPPRLAALARLLRQRGIRKKFLVYGRADFIAQHEEIIREWSDLGLTAVIVGLEAATDAELESLTKGCTVDHNRRAVDVLRRNGVDVYASFITQPDYGAEQWARLRRFIDDNGLYYVNISPVTPMPGTTIWKEHEAGVTVEREAHGLWDFSHVVLPTRTTLREYYRSLLRVYAHTVLDVRRAKGLSLRTLPPVWSKKYLRLWLGAFKIFVQFRTAYRHHQGRELHLAKSVGRSLRIQSGSCQASKKKSCA